MKSSKSMGWSAQRNKAQVYANDNISCDLERVCRPKIYVLKER